MRRKLMAAIGGIPVAFCSVAYAADVSADAAGITIPVPPVVPEVPAVVVPEPEPEPRSYFSIGAGIIHANLPGMFSGITMSGDGAPAAFGAPDTGRLGYFVDLRAGFSHLVNPTFAIGVEGRAWLTFFGADAFARTATFTGPGAIIIGGLGEPADAEIELLTASTGGVGALAGASAIATDANAVATGSLQVSFSPVGGSAAGWATSTSGGASVFTGFVTDGDAASAAAYAAAFDPNGGVFFGIGDLTGLEVAYDFSETIRNWGIEIPITFSFAAGNSWITPYIGPTYFAWRRNYETTTSVTIPGDPPTPFPVLDMTRIGSIDARYLGGVAGLAVSVPLSASVDLNLRGQGGLHWYWVNVTEAFTFGGLPGGFTSGATSGANGVTWSVRGEAELAFDVARNTQISISGAFDYLADAPGLAGAAPQFTLTQANPADDDATLSFTSGGGTGTGSFTDALWSVAGRVAVRFVF